MTAVTATILPLVKPSTLPESDRDDPALGADPVTLAFRQHGSFVRRCLRRLGVGSASLDDATQDVFLVVHRRADDYRDQGVLKAWLFAICRRVASHYRRRSDRRGAELQPVETGSGSGDLEESMARREAIAFVEGFLDGLDERLRMVFYLAQIEGFTAPEIAGALGLKLNTVYSRLRRARAAFERAVAERRKGGNPHG